MKKRYFECTPILIRVYCTADNCDDKRELVDTLQRRLLYGSDQNCAHQCGNCKTEYWLDRSYPTIDFFNIKKVPVVIDRETREYDPESVT